jgi:hypothetical protein
MLVLFCPNRGVRASRGRFIDTNCVVIDVIPQLRCPKKVLSILELLPHVDPYKPKFLMIRPAPGWLGGVLHRVRYFYHASRAALTFLCFRAI